jgi:hypothetical protein
MKIQTRRGKERKLAADDRISGMGCHKRPGENSRSQTLTYIEEINHRAETMTPVLKEILDFRPSPHWN